MPTAHSSSSSARDEEEHVFTNSGDDNEEEDLEHEVSLSSTNSSEDMAGKRERDQAVQRSPLSYYEGEIFS